MPITRATSRGLTGAAQTPSTIYTNYNEIVSIIQGGLPPRRASRAPKRPREEPEYIDHEEFLEWLENPQENAQTSTSTSTLTAEEKKAAKWCCDHLGDCEGCGGSEALNDWSEVYFWIEISKLQERISAKHPDCPLCEDLFSRCKGECYAKRIPEEIKDRMSPKKHLTLHLNTLLKICELYC